jgi:hypothetical protein
MHDEMSRRVLIIGSPLAGQNFLHGVKDDVQNVYRYVTSSTGGAHTDQEIRYLPNPSVANVQKLLNSVGEAELFTVYFSGHGGRSANRDYVWLNEKEAFPVTSFLTKAKRHIILTDSCRTPIDLREMGDVISGIGFHFPTDNADQARRLHLGYLKNAAQGDVFIFSTAENQPAMDSEMGGQYTNSFMTALHNWSYTQYEKVASVHQIFQRSRTLMREYKSQQVPKLQYNKDAGIVHLPLAINVHAHSNAARSRSQIGYISDYIV